MSSILLALAVITQDVGPTSDWRNVEAISAGTKIKLVMKAGSVEGTFVAANADVLVIHLKQGDFSVDRTNINRLDMRVPGSNRARNINRGLGLGLAAGVVRGFFNTGENAVGRVMLTMPFMALGTIGGATASATIWETLYRL